MIDIKNTVALMTAVDRSKAPASFFDVYPKNWTHIN